MSAIRRWSGTLGRSALALALGAGLLTAVSGPPAAAAPVQISGENAADPGFNRFGSTYYVHATGGKGSGILPVYRGTSTNKKFTRAGNAFRATPTGLKNFWAPHVIQRGSTFFMFFAAQPKRKPGETVDKKHCIYYAVSSRPSGDFHRTRKLVCGRNASWEAIDPSTYTTVEDNTYLVWRGGKITAGKFPLGDFDIKARRLTFTGSTVTFTNSSTYTLAGVRNKPVMEAPDVIRHDNKLYLFVSRGSFDTNGYHTEVWVGANIISRFAFSNRLMSTGTKFGYGPGGAEVLGKPSNKVFIAYHAWERSKPKPGPTTQRRVTRIADVVWVRGKPTVR